MTLFQPFLRTHGNYISAIISQGSPLFNRAEQGKALPFSNTSGGPTGSRAFRVWMLITDVACDCPPPTPEVSGSLQASKWSGRVLANGATCCTGCKLWMIQHAAELVCWYLPSPLQEAHRSSRMKPPNKVLQQDPWGFSNCHKQLPSESIDMRKASVRLLRGGEHLVWLTAWTGLTLRVLTELKQSNL